MNRMIKSGFIVAVMLAVLMAGAHAATAGVENITLTKYSGTLTIGNSEILNYSLSKVSGYYTFSTTFYVVGNDGLAANGISVILSPQFANPPITGVMHIIVSPQAQVGVYNITVGGNSTNETVHSATFMLDVVSEYPPTSISGTTTSMNTTSSISSTPTTVVATTSLGPTSTLKYISTPPTMPNSNSEYYLIILVIIIVLIIAVAAVMFSRKGKQELHHSKENAKNK